MLGVMTSDNYILANLLFNRITFVVAVAALRDHVYHIEREVMFIHETS